MLHTFDARFLSVTINGVPVSTGFAEGDVLTIPSAELYTTRVGIGGTHVRSRNADDGEPWTLKVMQSSKANDVLMAQLQIDNTTGRGTFAFQFFDGNSGSSGFSATAYIKSRPEFAFGTESGDVDWEIVLPDSVVDIKGMPGI